MLVVYSGILEYTPVIEAISDDLKIPKSLVSFTPNPDNFNGHRHNRKGTKKEQKV